MALSLQEYQRSYYLEHREKLIARSRRRAQANPAAARLWETKYRKTEKGHASRLGQRYRRRLRGGGKTLHQVLASAVLQANIEKYGRLTCVYCKTPLDVGIPFEVHFDHKVPLCKGGKTEKRNLVVSCSRCNLRKGTLHFRDFVRRVA